jgi:hypothetical protein
VRDAASMTASGRAGKGMMGVGARSRRELASLRWLISSAAVAAAVGVVGKGCGTRVHHI